MAKFTIITKYPPTRELLGTRSARTSTEEVEFEGLEELKSMIKVPLYGEIWIIPSDCIVKLRSKIVTEEV